MVLDDQCIKGSETAKSGTDGQKLHMRLFEEGKYPHLFNVSRGHISLGSSIEGNKTRGGARAHSVSWSYSTKKLLTEGLNVERLSWCNANVGSILRAWQI